MHTLVLADELYMDTRCRLKDLSRVIADRNGEREREREREREYRESVLFVRLEDNDVYVYAWLSFRLYILVYQRYTKANIGLW